MNPSNDVNNKFSNFIQFGGLMDRGSREYTANLIYNYYFDEDFDGPSELAESSITKEHPEWAYIINNIFEENRFRNLSVNNEQLSIKITNEALEWLKEVHFEFEREPEISEIRKDIDKFESTKDLMKNEGWRDLLKDIQKAYPDMSQVWTFYDDKLSEVMEKLKELKKDNKEKKKTEEELLAVKAKIEEDWKEAIKKRKNKKFKEFTEPKFVIFIKDWNEFYLRLEEFYLNMSSFFGYLGRFWDLSEGVWQNINWNLFEKYSQILEEEKEIQKLAEILGMYKESEEEYEIELLEKTVIKTDWKTESSGKSEITGVHFSDDLSSLLPSEVAHLSSQETEIIFSKNFIEKKLLTFEYQNRAKFEKEEKITEESKKLKEDKKGPIIACIDTSGSMHGTPEHIAKTLVFAVLKIALKEDRRCFLISFSTDIETLELTDLDRSMEKLVNFLMKSFHGGTDATPAFLKSLEMLESEDYNKADVVMVSDFVMPSLSKDLLDRIKEQKEENNSRFHSLVITSQHNPNFLEIFDNKWICNSTDTSSIRNLAKNVIDSFRTVSQ